MEDECNAELLAMLPLPVSPLSEGDTGLDTSEVKDASLVEVLRCPRKLLCSELVSAVKTPKKQRRPTLASVQQVIDENCVGGSSQRRALMTREQLRADAHDPRVSLI